MVMRKCIEQAWGDKAAKTRDRLKREILVPERERNA
jgi:hypothetical protein